MSEGWAVEPWQQPRPLPPAPPRRAAAAAGNDKPWMPAVSTIVEKQARLPPAAEQSPPGATGLTTFGRVSDADMQAGAGNPFGRTARPAASGSPRSLNLAGSTFTSRPLQRTMSRVLLPTLLIALMLAGGSWCWYAANPAFASPPPDGPVMVADAQTAGRTLAFPRQAMGLHRMTPSVKLNRQVSRTLVGNHTDALRHTQVALFAPAGSKQPAVLVVAVRPIDVPEYWYRIVRDGSARTVSLLASVTLNPAGQHGGRLAPIQSMYPGQLGGGMSCSTTPADPQAAGVCLWADRSYVAMTVVRRSHQMSKNIGQVALLTRAVRAAAEH